MHGGRWAGLRSRAEPVQRPSLRVWSMLRAVQLFWNAAKFHRRHCVVGPMPCKVVQKCCERASTGPFGGVCPLLTSWISLLRVCSVSFFGRLDKPRAGLGRFCGWL